VLVNSDVVKMFTTKHFSVSPAKIKIVYNGIDIMRFKDFKESTKLRNGLSISKKARIVGTVGKLSSPQKNIPLFLRSAKIVAGRLSDVRFVVVGGGRLLNLMKNLSSDLGISEKVHFTGEREDIPEILDALDVFVLSSYKEGLPNVIMEAMAAAKPVVATSVGGVPELVVDGVTGFLVPSNDEEKLSQAVIRLLTNPEMSKEMGEEGRRRVSEFFSADRMIKEIESLYSHLL
jgi:glycosyltransferase involved in cell wall biosynthesis